ncbi:MAG: Gldg family protein [Wenzhouxiangella sp.]
MRQATSRHWYSSTALALLAILFLALTMLSGAFLSGVRLDLTENRLYTLSDGTISLLEAIEEPITLEFYFSEEASSDLPMVRNYARRVQEMLDEMVQRADGRLIVRRINPEPFSEAEDRAALLGLEGVPVGRGRESLYLGLVGTNRVDGREVLPFLSPAREAFLEYELARMVYILSQPQRPRVGWLSGLPMTGGMDFRTGQPQEPWAVYQEVSELFELEQIDPSDQELPADIDVLVLVHPRDLDQGLLADIEAFLLAGGRLLAFLDPYAETDPGPDPTDPSGALTADRHSSLAPLLEAWGVEFSTEDFVADLGLAVQVNLQQGQPPVRHPAILGLTAANMSNDDVITGDLEVLNLASSGWFELSDDSPLALDPLLRSSASAGPLATERLRLLADPSALVDEVGVTGERYALAARISGPVEAALAPEGIGDAPTAGEINAILVADADFLADRYWVQRQRFFGTSLLEPFANNADFVINAIDNLLGNADLISVRGRATSSRPFTLVEDLRRSAEQSLRATEQRLEADLAEAEGRLNELQQARADADLSVLTPEQEAEIDRFMTRRLEIRQQLRQVRRDLDREIEALGTRVKVINIALMPLLVTVFALILAWRRRLAFQRSRTGVQP